MKTILATTADKVGGVSYGADPYGTCSGCTWSSAFGYGRIDIDRALAPGGGGSPQPPPPPPPPPAPQPLAPAVATGAAGGIGQTQATVAGTVNPNGAATTWWVEYGLGSTYGSQTIAQNLASGTSPVSVSASLSGLVAGTTYHYRVAARNPTGTTYGSDATLLTSPVPPPPPPPGSPVTVITYPTAVTIVTGSSPSGVAASLAGINGSYYSLRSPFLGSPSWYGTFTVDPSATDFKVTYNGTSTRSCSLSLAVYRWTTGAWVAAGSSVTVGTSAVTLADAAPAATVPVSELQNSGQVRVRATCVGGFSFSTYTLNSDMLQLSYRK